MTLQRQMKEKSETQSLIKAGMNSVENQQMMVNNIEMKMQQDQRVQQKEEVTAFWQDQLAAKNELTVKEREAAAAYKKLPVDI